MPPWREPVRGEYPHPSAARLSGVEQLRVLIESGAAPPIGRLVGTALTDVGLGGASFSMPATRWLLSPHRDHRSEGQPRATGPPDGRKLRAHGRVRHAGRTISIAEADVVNADGKPVALATGSAMVLPGRAAALDGPD